MNVDNSAMATKALLLTHALVPDDCGKAVSTQQYNTMASDNNNHVE